MDVKLNLVAALAMVCCLLLGCANHRSDVDDLRSHVSHVVIVVQENRSFDNLFHGFVGADYAEYGLAHDGTRVPLQAVPLDARYDITNSAEDFLLAYDEGTMRGYDLRRPMPIRGSGIPLALAQYPTFAYVRRHDIQPYWDLAKRYTLADRMFQSNIDQSFAAHLYLIAGQAFGTVNVPNRRPWGCDADPRRTYVRMLLKDRSLGARVPPCFDLQTLGDELDSAGLSWRYYAPSVVPAGTWRNFPYAEEQLGSPGMPDFGGNWNAYDAIAHVRRGRDWTYVVSPETRFLTDIQRGRLANVTWIVPSWRNSDHPLSMSETGPSWVAAIVNAVGESSYWKNTAIFITWDDSGGWYDHVAPPKLDYDGLGVRVPLIVVSAYAKNGYVSHVRHEFGSILKFSEELFKLSSLSDSDRRADDLLDCFMFDRAPASFKPIGGLYKATYFMSTASRRSSATTPALTPSRRF